MISTIHRELLESLMRDRSVEYMTQYIAELEERIQQMESWVKYVKEIRKRKMRKPLDTGVRGGS